MDLDSLWHAIDQVIVKTIISAWPILKHSYHACFPSHDMVLFYFIVVLASDVVVIEFSLDLYAFIGLPSDISGVADYHSGCLAIRNLLPASLKT